MMTSTIAFYRSSLLFSENDCNSEGSSSLLKICLIETRFIWVLIFFFSSSCSFIIGSLMSRDVPVRKISGRIIFLTLLKVSFSLKVARIVSFVFFKSFSFAVSNFLNNYFSLTRFIKTVFKLVSRKSVLKSRKQFKIFVISSSIYS